MKTPFTLNENYMNVFSVIGFARELKKREWKKKCHNDECVVVWEIPSFDYIFN